MHNSQRTAWLLIFILIIAAFFRLWNLSDVPPGLYPDEAMNGNNALYVLESGDFKVFYTENNGREGLYINIIAGSLALFGNEPWAIRLVSAIFGILTVLGLFFLTRELSGRDEIALLAAFFLAVSFWHINFSRIGFRAIMAPFFLVWSMYFLWLVFRQDLSYRTKTLAAVFGGVFFGLGFHTYIAYRLAPLLLAVPVLKIKKEGGFRFLGWFVLAALVAGLPLGIYFWQNPGDFLGRTSQISIFASDSPLKEFALNLAKTFGSFWFFGDVNARHNLPGSPHLWWPVGILFAIGLFGRLTSTSNENSSRWFPRELFSLLWLWLILFSLPVAFSSEGLPHALRSILMLPPALIFAAVGFWQLADTLKAWLDKQAVLFPEKLKRLKRIKGELFLLFVIFLAVHIVITYSNYFIRWANLPETYFAFSKNYAGIGQWLKGLPDDIPKYAVLNARGAFVRAPDDQNTKPLPMPAQTIMFLTNTWPASKQSSKNIHYILPTELDQITCYQSCLVTFLERDPSLNLEIKKILPDIKLSIKPGFPVFYKNIDF